MVSIHARLATGDIEADNLFGMAKVSIHARLATGDWEKACETYAKCKFQFTPVLRRATLSVRLFLPDDAFQFTPVLRRATGIIGNN